MIRQSSLHRNTSATLRVLLLPLLVAGSAFVLATCDSDSPVDPAPTELAAGTWGAIGAGVIVGEKNVHVHVGCTFGDFPAPIALDADLHFSVPGEYLLRAYPVAMGPTMPAQFAGVLNGNRLTLSIAVNDTIEKQLVVLGPVTVILGQEPNMGPCPICENPPER